MTTLLAILGALGGVILLWQLAKRGWILLKQLRASGLATEKDYRYKSVEVGDRWIDAGKHVVQRRSCKLIALQDNLRSLRVGFGPSSKATIVVRVISGSISLREIEPSPPNADWIDFSLDFDRPLRKREEAFFAIEAVFKARSGVLLPPRLSWMSNRRVDSLTLRVVFVDPNHDAVVIRGLDSMGERRFEEALQVNALSQEARWKTQYATPGMMYVLTWKEELNAA